MLPALAAVVVGIPAGFAVFTAAAAAAGSDSRSPTPAAVGERPVIDALRSD